MSKIFSALLGVAALCLSGCASTNGIATLTPAAQTDVSKVLSDAQTALTVGGVAIGLAEATGEIEGQTATNINAVMIDLQAVLTAAQGGDTAATATTLAAKLAAAQTALNAIQTAAPQDATLINAVRQMLTAFVVVETALPPS